MVCLHLLRPIPRPTPRPKPIKYTLGLRPTPRSRQSHNDNGLIPSYQYGYWYQIGCSSHLSWSWSQPRSWSRSSATPLYTIVYKPFFIGLGLGLCQCKHTIRQDAKLAVFNPDTPISQKSNRKVNITTKYWYIHNW